MSFPKEHDIRIGTLVNGGENSARVIKQLLEHGFESFSLTFWQQVDEKLLPRMCDEVMSVLDGSNAVISNLSVFGNPLESEEMDIITRNGWKVLTDWCDNFNTDMVTGFCGRVRNKEVPASIEKFKEVFGEITDYANGKNVRIAIENCNMGGNWNNGDWNIGFNPTAWEMMFDAVPAENLGLEWEPCHQMVQLIDPLPQLRKWASKIFHVHGKDATIKWDVIREYGISGVQEFVQHRTPGFGDTNWTDIISVLRENDYCGNIDIEGWHDPVYRDKLEYTGQVRALNYLKECRGGDYIDIVTD